MVKVAKWTELSLPVFRQNIRLRFCWLNAVIYAYEFDFVLSLTSNLEIVVSIACISDKVIPVGISYRDHLNNCPTESSKECSFCLLKSKSKVDVVKVSRHRNAPNRFTCTFCNLELPSSDTAKSHVKEAHNVSNVQFVPVDINKTDMEKNRFLVSEDKCLKRQKRPIDSSFYTEIRKTVANMKRSKVVIKEDDLQLTTIGNTANSSKQQVERKPVESQPQHNTRKRKYSNESTDVSKYFLD